MISADEEKEDELKVKLQDDEVTFVLRRAAGGKMVAELPERGDLKRWGIVSADGWELGQPGPGPKWRPHRGVKLRLEELGCCHKCQKPVAVPEYICNNLARPWSAKTAAAQRRVRTFEASTQTEATYTEVEVQATAPVAEAEAQAQVVESLSRSQAALAGHALATLAAPGEGSDSTQMILTSNFSVASQQLREALTQLKVASTSADVEATMQLRAAEEALQRLAPQADSSQESDPSTVAPIPGETQRGQSVRLALRQLRHQMASFEGDGMHQVMKALTSLSELLPLCMGPGIPSWRQVAESGSWPWGGVDVPGWPQLKEALSALSQLALGPPEPSEAPGFFQRAVKALCELVAFLDERKAAAAAAAAGPPSTLTGPASPTLPSGGLTLPGFGGLGGLGGPGFAGRHEAPPLTLPNRGPLGAMNPVNPFLAQPGMAPLSLGGGAAANPVDMYLASATPSPPGIGANTVDAFLSAPLEPPSFGKKATISTTPPAGGTGGGAKDMQNAMQGLFSKRK